MAAASAKRSEGSRVITDHDSSLRPAVSIYMFCNGGRHFANPRKCKFFGHDRTPAIGSKLDHQSYPRNKKVILDHNRLHLDIKAEVNDVAIFHDIVFTF